VTPMNATTKTTPSVVSVAPKTNTSTPAIPQVKAAAPTPAPRTTTNTSTSYPSASTTVNPKTGKSNAQVLAEAQAVLDQTAAEGSKPYAGSSYQTSSTYKAEPSKPAVPSAAKTADEKAMKTYQSLMNPSKEELATQEDLDKLIESTKKGYLNTENQVIPMQFITGQLSAMEKRAGVLAEPLQAKLGRLQAARTSSLEASKFALERADKALAAETAATQPTTVGGNIVKFNPITGQYDTVYSAPTKTTDEGFTLSAGQTRYDATGKPIASSAAKTTAGTGTGTGAGTAGVSPVAQNIIDLINKGADMDTLIKGTSKESQNLRNEVYRGLAAQGGRPTAVVELFKEGKEIVDDLLNTEAYKALGGYSSVLGGQFGTGYGDAMAKAQQLSAILARDNLGLLKGAMSDKDLEFIKAMSTGFDGAGIQSEQYLKDRLTTIQTKLANKIGESGGTSQPSSNSQPSTFKLPNGTFVYLQADGTYR